MLAAVMALLPVENADEGEQDADEQALGAPLPGLEAPLLLCVSAKVLRTNQVC